MDKKIIDINCDLGEGLANDAELMPYISSCNIACGGHTGNESSMRATIRLAKKHKVKIGAHPSYPDTANFGRKTMELSPKQFRESIGQQLAVFGSIVEEEAALWHHIKPHGALYNELAKNAQLAAVFLDACGDFLKDRYLYVPFQSEIAALAVKSKLKIMVEAFADRNYNRDLSLVSRTSATAVITNPVKVLEHLVRMVHEGKVKTVNGDLVPLNASTFCVHGDTSSALEILMYLHQELPKYNIQFLK